MNAALPEVHIVSRFTSPAPMPMALAFENGNLWIGSAKEWTFHGVRLSDQSVFASAKSPAKPYGSVLIDQTLRVIVGDDDDNRTIRSYVLHEAFSDDCLPCPRDTGNFLAYDGSALYVSQRYDQLLVRVDDRGCAVKTTPMPRQVVGITYVDTAFYLLTTDGNPADDDIRFARMELTEAGPVITELARVPFGARALTHDGTRFWTSWRENHTVVSFGQP